LVLLSTPEDYFHGRPTNIEGEFMSKKLYVGNLNYDMNSSELQQLFAAHGIVNSAQIIDDRDTGRSKGFGFVEMENEVEAEAAIAALNEKEHGGRKLAVNEAKSRLNRSGAFGDGRSGKGAASGGGRSRH
jgi:cold-inducible RNA-binding protein